MVHIGVILVDFILYPSYLIMLLIEESLGPKCNSLFFVRRRFSERNYVLHLFLIFARTSSFFLEITTRRSFADKRRAGYIQPWCRPVLEARPAQEAAVGKGTAKENYVIFGDCDCHPIFSRSEVISSSSSGNEPVSCLE